MKGLTYKQVLEEKIKRIVKEYDKLSEAYHKQRTNFAIWISLITLLYSVIAVIIINNLKQ